MDTNFVPKIKAWLYSLGIAVEDTAHLTATEYDHFKGVLCHRFGIEPERIADATVHPSTLPPFVLDSIHAASGDVLIKPVSVIRVNADLDVAVATPPAIEQTVETSVTEKSAVVETPAVEEPKVEETQASPESTTKEEAVPPYVERYPSENEEGKA